MTKAEEKELKVDDIRKLAEEKKCAVQRALYYTEAFLAGPMCGRCLPCSLGSYEAKERLLNIIGGTGTEADLRALERIMVQMLSGSMCKKGKDTAQFITDWMATDVFRRHIEGACPEKECRAFIEFRIIPEKCIVCGLCKDACKHQAIHGEKAKPFRGGYFPFEIRQKKCVKCGDCVPVCPTEAIVIVDIKSSEPVRA
jgi:NAD-dependent dihydropyrimidine dehydrogenase PreA subunit